MSSLKKKKTSLKEVYIDLIHVSIYTTIQIKSVFIAHTRTHHLTLSQFILFYQQSLANHTNKTINKI